MRGTAPHLMVVGKTGTGKAQALTTEVPTPTGWTTMWELCDGDTIFDEAGKPCTVTKAHPIRYDRPCYELEFSDGSTIVADAEHLWWTEARLDRVSQSELRPAFSAYPRMSLPTAERPRNRADRRMSCPLPELARLAGMSPSHVVLREIAAEVGPHSTRRRPAADFVYPGQTVHQRQPVTVFDRAAALGFLASRAESPRWRYPVTAAELLAFAAQSASEEMTFAGITKLLHCSTDTAVEVMRHSGVPRSKNSAHRAAAGSRPHGAPPSAWCGDHHLSGHSDVGRCHCVG